MYTKKHEQILWFLILGTPILGSLIGLLVGIVTGGNALFHLLRGCAFGVATGFLVLVLSILVSLLRKRIETKKGDLESDRPK